MVAFSSRLFADVLGPVDLVVDGAKVVAGILLCVAISSGGIILVRRLFGSSSKDDAGENFDTHFDG